MTSDFEENVKKGFSACKSDISLIKSENSQLKDEVLDLKSEIKGLKIAIDLIKDLVSNQSQNSTPVLERIETVAPKKEIEKDSYDALLEFKARSNKRDLLKQKILSMVGESGLSLSELKFMFVEHFKYTSKATFYNYLKELELERHIKIERENSKNHVFRYEIKKEI